MIKILLTCIIDLLSVNSGYNPPSCDHFWFWRLDSENSRQVGDQRKLILEETTWMLLDMDYKLPYTLVKTVHAV